MNAEVGAFLAALALAASLAQGAFGLIGGGRAEARLGAAAAGAAQVAAAALAGAFVLLIVSFVRSDFSVAIVAQHSHTAKPLFYKIAGAWGQHEGSMLLWCLVSALVGALMAAYRGALSETLWMRALGVQGLLTAGAALYTLVLSNPFARLLPAPLEGSGLNPLLQDPSLAAHPPLLYLGYVGLSAPFSLSLAALLEGRFDQAWARALRPWTLGAWTALTVGISLGAYWAYYELGWGGWWAWDPVENASFLPWLAAAALLHSAIVTERRGSLAGWTLLLAISAFGLSILGTFLVRSGVLSSVHAFATDPRRGVAVLALLALALGWGFGLYAWRAPNLPAPRGFAFLSREGALVLNNFTIALCAGVVMLGTLYPLFAQALDQRSVSVGAPYFTVTFGPLASLVLLAAPFGPLLAWRKGRGVTALRALLGAGVAAGLAFAGALLAGGGVAAALGLALGAWMIVGSIAYVWKRCEGRPARLIRLPLAVWALALAHAGVGVLAVGAVAQASFRVERSASLAVGESLDFAGRRLTLQAVTVREGPNYDADHARFLLDESGRLTTLTAERRYFWTSTSPTTEVGIRSSLAGDVYVAFGERVQGSSPAQFSVRAHYNPFVVWIFGGAALIALGGGLGLAALVRKRVAPAPAVAPALAE